VYVATQGCLLGSPVCFELLIVIVLLGGGEIFLAIPKREPKPGKVKVVAEIKDVLNASTVILTDYHGLDAKGIADLRKRLRDNGSGYRVVKNTLLTRAAVDTAASALTEGLCGQTALIYTDADPVAAAKTLLEFAKTGKHVKAKSGIMDGHLLSAAQVEALAKIPGKMELYAMLVGGLQGPIYGLVGTLKQTIGQLVMTLQGVADKQAGAAA
jgi:large subunit ribosomal protein L10